MIYRVNVPKGIAILNYENTTPIQCLKNLKNSGIDKINTKTLKTLKMLISEPVAHIPNLCIEMAIWPDVLKIAEIISVYKLGDKLEVDFYSTTTLISNFLKSFRNYYTTKF